jgi:hypothetical protein
MWTRSIQAEHGDALDSSVDRGWIKKSKKDLHFD